MLGPVMTRARGPPAASFVSLGTTGVSRATSSTGWRPCTMLSWAGALSPTKRGRTYLQPGRASRELPSLSKTLLGSVKTGQPRMALDGKYCCTCFVRK